MKKYIIILNNNQRFICLEDELQKWKILFRNKIVNIEEIKQEKKK